MTIEQLGLRSTSTSELIRRACRPLGEDTEERKRNEAWLCSVITVEQVLYSSRQYIRHYKATSPMRTFTRKLTDLGLTRFDWPFMPQTTVTPEILRAFSKEELLRQPAIGLPTVSLELILCMESYIDDFAPNDQEFLRFRRPTVSELLALHTDRGAPESLEHDLRTRFWQTVWKTRDLLRELGFEDSDGEFMVFGGRTEALRRGLETKYGLTHNESSRVVNIAREEGWISKYLVEGD